MKLRKRLSIILIVLGFLIAISGRFTLLAGLPFFIIGVIINFTTDRALWAKLTITILPILLWLPLMLGFWYFKNKSVSQSDTYIFPKNFRGQAIIAFGINNGNTTVAKDGRRLFKFDTSRILVTQAQVSTGIVDQQFFYQDEHGQLTPIPTYGYMQDTKENKDSSTVKVFGWHEIGSTGSKDCSYKFLNFKVCSLAELDTIDNGFRSWKMQDKIKRVACGE